MFLVDPDIQVYQVIAVNQAIQVYLVIVVRQDFLDIKAHKAHKVPKGHKDLQVQQVQPVRKVLLDHKALQDILVKQAHKAQLARRV